VSVPSLGGTVVDLNEWRLRVYLHSTTARQRALADAVGEAARAELANSKKRQMTRSSGTRMARNRRPAGESGK
jgi:hypothetical protein